MILSRKDTRTITVKLVQSCEVLNTRVIAEIVANQIKRGDVL